MLSKGFKFGMLLQFAIGPVCIFIFQAAVSSGFYAAETGVIGVFLVDGIYILAAIWGIAKGMEKEPIKMGLKIFGSMVLLIFGLNMIISVFDIRLLPKMRIPGLSDINNPFMNAVILTVSNPLTLFFWAGVFAAKLSEDHMKRRDVYLFGFGAALSTLVFLTLIAGIGSMTKTFFPTTAVQVLNLVVGVSLVYFSLKRLLKK